MLGKQEGPAFEFLHFSIRAPGSLGENNDGNPFFEEEGSFLDALQGGLSALPFDENVAGKIKKPAEDGKPEEGFFGNEAHRKWSRRDDARDIQNAGVVGGQDVGFTLLQILGSPEVQADAIGPQKPIDPELLEEERPSTGPV